MSENQKNQNRFQRNPRLTLAFFAGFIMIFIFVCAEIFLRFIGYEPGKVYRNHLISLTDSVFLLKGYQADSLGIMRCSNEGRLLTAQYLAAPKYDTAGLWMKSNIEYCLKQTIADFHALKYVGDTGYFGKFAEKIKSDPHPDSLTLAVRDYLNCPINSDGFRSIAFKRFSGKRKRILLVGDSFSWGLSGKPLYNCFADRLLAAGYVVYNAGIVCADPAQYAAIVEKYAPILQPDIVVVNYFVGNDGMYHERKTEAGQFLYYPTNAGWLCADPAGEYLKTPQEAYRFAINALYMPKDKLSMGEKLLAKTVVTTKFWYLWSNWRGKLPKEMALYEQQRFHEGEKSLSEIYLRRIKNVCDAQNAQLITSLIPEFQLLDSQLIKEKINFSQTTYVMPENLSVEDYSTNQDAHLNNAGMAKYAAFLQKQIEQLP